VYDYGGCHICGERMEERRIKQEFWIKGKLTLLRAYPQGSARGVARSWSRRTLDGGLQR